MAEENKEAEVLDLTNDSVVTKYGMAGDIANRCLLHVAAMCKTGARIVTLCDSGDNFITAECAKIFTKQKKLRKGVAFPVCISRNNTMGHFSPTADDETLLQKGDVVKIDLGVHVDGFLAVAAHTAVVGDEGPIKEEIVGRIADVMHAAHWAAECGIRMMKAGQKSHDITAMSQEIAAEFGCKPVSGVLSHQLERFNLDGKKQVLMAKAETEQKVEDFEFAVNDVFAFDFVMSTGEGRPRDQQTKITIYNRRPDSHYQLKTKASRATLGEIISKYDTLPFTIRNLDKSNSPTLGLVEITKHNLVEPYPVLYEAEGEFIAHVKFTALLLPSGAVKVAGNPVDISQYKTDKKLTNERWNAILATSAKRKKKNNKKKKK